MADALGPLTKELDARRANGLMRAASVINSAFTFDEALQLITDQARLVIGAHQAATNVLVGDWSSGNWEHVINGLSLSDKYAEYVSYEKPPNGTGIYDMVVERSKHTE